LWRENNYLSFPFDLERVPFFPLLELALYCLDVGKEIPDILLRLGPLVSGKRRMQNIGVRGAFDTECAVIGFTGSQASEGLLDFGAFFYQEVIVQEAILAVERTASIPFGYWGK